MSQELYHYGVKGMKWGIRRYQNEDGTYTKRGLERYRKAEQDYDNAVSKQRSVKESLKSGSATKSEYREARADVKSKKQSLEKSYKNLKYDKRADQGKELYRSGKTISGNTLRNIYVQGLILVGSKALESGVFSKYMDQKAATIASSAVAAGATIANAAFQVKTVSDNKKLRAYYAHR